MQLLPSALLHENMALTTDVRRMHHLQQCLNSCSSKGKHQQIIYKVQRHTDTALSGKQKPSIQIIVKEINLAWQEKNEEQVFTRGRPIVDITDTNN